MLYQPCAGLLSPGRLRYMATQRVMKMVAGAKKTQPVEPAKHIAVANAARSTFATIPVTSTFGARRLANEFQKQITKYNKGKNITRFAKELLTGAPDPSESEPTWAATESSATYAIAASTLITRSRIRIWFIAAVG